jgi:hypothetical protein
MNRQATTTPGTNTEPIDDQDQDLVEPDDQDDAADHDDQQQPPPVAVATVDDEEFGSLTPREKSLVQKARSQEKTKLYATIDDLKSRLKALERTPLPTVASTNGGNTTTTTRRARDQRDEEIQELRGAIQTLTTALSDKNQRDEKRERDRELKQYRRELVQDRRGRGVNFIEALVTGDSEEALDLSMQLAEAEAEYQRQKLASEYGIDLNTPRPNGDVRRPSRTTVVVQRDTPRRPEDVPSTVQPGVSGNSSDYLTKAQLAAMCDITSIRNGTYAANRELIQRMVREGNIRD